MFGAAGLNVVTKGIFLIQHLKMKLLKNYCSGTATAFDNVFKIYGLQAEEEKTKP